MGDQGFTPRTARRRSFESSESLTTIDENHEVAVDTTFDRKKVCSSLEKKLSLRADVDSLLHRNILREGTQFPHLISQHMQSNLPIKKEKLVTLVKGSNCIPEKQQSKILNSVAHSDLHPSVLQNMDFHIASCKLQRLLKNRSSRQALQDRNVLPHDGAHPHLMAETRKQRFRRASLELSKLLPERPTADKLVEKNILEMAFTDVSPWASEMEKAKEFKDPKEILSARGRPSTHHFTDPSMNSISELDGEEQD
uniref:Uncharacterized protein n=1 Tax=Palpitomonas bilix TaxID=652834 RepID=A0A7S3G0Z9_9EUKA|mmetsp:Transcript_19948/g.50950  ORF Transcript_19948/g.50950 Transcript_19948/m.50950 type:complete len:253 (+) Transcript_19948:267-1025(+)